MHPRLILLPVALTAAGIALAQQDMPAEAAKAFSLDLPASEPSATPTPTASPTAADPAPATEPRVATPVVPATDAASVTAPALADGTPKVRAVFTLDTPIQDLIADPGAKAVLDQDLPGMSDDENLDKFKTLSLRSLQPQTGGQLTDALLAKVAADLDKLAGGAGAVTAPVKVGSAKRGKDDSR